MGAERQVLPFKLFDDLEASVPGDLLREKALSGRRRSAIERALTLCGKHLSVMQRRTPRAPVRGERGGDDLGPPPLDSDIKSLIDRLDGEALVVRKPK